MESCGPEPTSIWLSENNLTLTGYSIGRFNLIEHAVPNAPSFIRESLQWIDKFDCGSGAIASLSIMV